MDRLRLPGGPHPVDRHRDSNVLESDRREAFERCLDLVLNLVDDLLGEADSSRLRERLDPGGDVDRVPQHVARRLHHIPHVDPDTDLDRAGGVEGCIVGAEHRLDLQGRLDRIERARKFDQEGVAHRFDLFATELGEDGPKQLVVTCQRSERSAFVLLHPGRVADHVREHDGGQTPVARCHGGRTDSSEIRAYSPNRGRHAVWTASGRCFSPRRADASGGWTGLPHSPS